MTPIDPTDTRSLMRVGNDACGDVRWGKPDACDVAMECVIPAVARAVCPEHHAVYDTRTHVAGPIDALNKAIVGLEMTRDGQLATWRPERSEAVAMLRSLLPTEAVND